MENATLLILLMIDQIVNLRAAKGSTFIIVLLSIGNGPNLPYFMLVLCSSLPGFIDLLKVAISYFGV